MNPNCNTILDVYKKARSVRGGVKKVALLGGAHHKVAYPAPLVVVKVPLFCGNFFICLESPDREKNEQIGN